MFSFAATAAIIRANLQNLKAYSVKVQHIYIYIYIYIYIHPQRVSCKLEKIYIGAAGLIDSNRVSEICLEKVGN